MSKEAMKLALKAFKAIKNGTEFWDMYPPDHAYGLAKTAITALEALAEQPAQQEPVTDEENEKFSRDVSGFKGADPEATKYALEEFLRNRVPAIGDIRALKHRIHALEGDVIGYKQLLDAAEQPAQQEPVYHLRQFGDVTKEQFDRYMATGDINQQPAQQEPIATLWQHSETGRTRITMPGDITDCDARWFKAADLYTSPPAQRTWVGLTNEDIALIDWESLVTKKDCVQAIEAKIKEKNT